MNTKSARNSTMIIAGSRGLPCRVTAIIRLHFSGQLRLERQGLQYIRAVDGTVHFAGRSSEQPLPTDEDVLRLLLSEACTSRKSRNV